MKNLLLLGMLSKSIGQIIRVMHVLFHLEREDPLPNVISNEALDAAINFVEVCCQHTAYISGHSDINQDTEPGTIM